MILANQSAASQLVKLQPAERQRVALLHVENRAQLVQQPAQLQHLQQQLLLQPKQHQRLRHRPLQMLKNSQTILI